MRTAVMIALAAISVTPATADTLVDHVDGLQVGRTGKLQHFTGLVIGKDGKVVQLLGASDARPTRIKMRIDGQGHALLPGLIDAHGHVMELGAAALSLDLTDTHSLAELQQRLKAYAAAHLGTGWIQGRGWNQELWPVKNFPTAADLDGIVPSRPVVLRRVDGHALIANSAAMRAAGVTAETTAPSGGLIEQGLFVDNAMTLIESKIAPATKTERNAWLAKALEILRGYGLTATADMGTDPADWAAMRRAGRRGELTTRIMSYGAGIDGAKAISADGPTAWFSRDRLKMEGVKLYADGALGSRGAWLKAPYADKPDTRGLQFHSDADYDALVAEAARRRYQIATHAIGDAANAQVIRSYIGHGASDGDRRWRIEHVQVVAPEDLALIGANHIIASMQPTHQTSDRTMAEARLGPARLAGAYAWHSMIVTGAHLAFGSDYPVESANPFPGIAAAISRQDPRGQPPGGWRPEEKVTLAQALASFTREAAYAGFAEDRLGSLDPGHWADFIMVDRDIASATPIDIAAMKVLETWVAGKKVWASEPVAPAR
ncbi:amidohydrolase [Sphingomonas sp.]|uniref:amidohydrolase n=1 Tax=Sphingomonas sp. TaxID=28214 RepID=UPI00286A049E|nr:amidohydrolase [Sphingomonas sp.]